MSAGAAPAAAVGAGPPRAEVLAVGDELLHGVIVDRNSAHVARELGHLGCAVQAITVVGDDPHALGAAIAAACARAAVVVATGGLGPTEDDRTRAAAAAAAGVQLAFDEPSWQQIEAMFAARGLSPPASNRVQATLPAGAEALRNDCGTAPGFALRIGRAWFAALPGVPREMRAMLAHEVLPRLRAFLGPAGAVALHELHVVGLQEAQVGERIAEWMRAGREPQVGVTATDGLLTVRIASHGASEAQARARCEATAAEIRPRLGDFLLYEGSEPLAERTARALLTRGTTVALAESCTGGLVAAELTRLPGVSAVFRAGLVTYANDAKVALLGVPQDLLTRHGAVSPEVAAAMAEGAARAAGAQLGLGVTGIAGPGGGTPAKPVGTVCFGLAAPGRATESWTRAIPDFGRRFVRARAAVEALAALLRWAERAGES